MAITNGSVVPRPSDKLRRRSQRRQHFTASAMVFEPKSQTLLRARTADLGTDGCFIDTLNPFVKGTAVKVRIEKAGASFEAWARVVYSLQSMGMGVAFQSVGPEQLWVIHEWLGQPGEARASEIQLPVIERSALANSVASDAHKDAQCEALVDLVEELMAQNLISREKGNAILRKLNRCAKSQ
jgi:hypothetical protein